jgi:hypothetical protein
MGEIMQFKRKCLFRNSNKSFDNEPTALESLWAYITLKGEVKRSGRYRIRITKFGAEDMVAMGMVDDSEMPPGVGFALQGILEEWNADSGWIPVLDWVGNPDLLLSEIENQLNLQYQAFVTGTSLENDFSFDYKPPKNPKVRNTVPPPKSVEPADTAPTTSDDFDWI